MLKKEFPDYSVNSYLMLADKNARTTVEGLNQKFSIQKDSEGKLEIVTENIENNDLGEPILTAVQINQIVEQLLQGPVKAGSKTPFTDWIHQLADAYGTVYTLDTIYAGRTDRIEYEYDQMNRVTDLAYASGQSIGYTYNGHGQLTSAALTGNYAGPVISQTLYDTMGRLSEITAANGIVTQRDYDENSRLMELFHGTSVSEDSIRGYSYEYDYSGNISQLRNSAASPLGSYYYYDEVNRLSLANMSGRFEADVNNNPQAIGWETEDYDSQSAFGSFDFSTQEVMLDYGAGSIGVDLGGFYEVTKITLSSTAMNNRVISDVISILRSDTNWEGSYVPVTDWTWNELENGDIEIRFSDVFETQYIKLHCTFDERNAGFEAVDNADMRNTGDDLITVHYYDRYRNEHYTYDDAGNRTSVRNEQQSIDETLYYEYYSNTNLLRDDGEHGFLYDENGNLTAMGDDYVISNGEPVFTMSEGYFTYHYDLQNRLIEVKRYSKETAEMETVARYVYDHRGYRIQKTNATGDEIRYTFSVNGVIISVSTKYDIV